MASSGEGPPEDGVFDLLTELCSNTASKYCSHNRISQKRLTNKMRTHAYEIILKKTTKEIPTSDNDPVVDLLSFYLVSHQNAKNVAEYRRCVELKKAISTIRRHDFGENKDNIDSVLKFLIGLSNSVKEDLSPEMYKSPFSFGLFNEMLPKPPREVFGSPQPYPYYPSHVFELPYSLRRQGRMLDSQISQTYTEYTVESFDSRALLADTASQQKSEVKTFLSPMSLASMTSTHLSPYSESLVNYPRLTGPRDLQIPSSPHTEANIKVSFTSTNEKLDMKEVFRAKTDDESLDIWELATQIDKDVPNDIWEIVSKLPPITERQLIASSSRELGLWKRIYADKMDSLKVVSERQFIRHIMYLIIGVETSSFPYNEETDALSLAEGVVLEGVSKPRLRRYSAALARAGSHYRRLYRFAFNHSLGDGIRSRGLVYEAAREVIRRYLLQYRLSATEIYEECCKSSSEDINCMPTLLQIAYHMEPLVTEIETVASIYRMAEPGWRNLVSERNILATAVPFTRQRPGVGENGSISYMTIYEECCKSSSEDINCMPTLLQIAYHMEPLVAEIETVASIYRMAEPDSKPSMPHGAELMSYLFNEISLVTHKKSALTMYTALYSICKVYFKFIERFIFEGELDDSQHEFFIRKDAAYVGARSKRYWDKGYHLAPNAVPGFLRPLARFILLCGKSLRLLKLCSPGGCHLAPGAVPGFLRPLARFILLCGKSLRLLKLCSPGVSTVPGLPGQGCHLAPGAVPGFLRPLARFILLCGKSLRLLKLCSPGVSTVPGLPGQGCHLAPGAVPGFLRPLARFILLCGKSLRLLKLCSPGDPLVLLVSSDHPRIECCRSFEELARQQELLRVYRTRCLFVREPASLRQLLLNREAERKAFAEMATLKQAETMEKIIAERKRLAQLIIAEKQHSLRVLEAAMAEAKAAKLKAKQRERRRYQLELEAEKATEEVDSKLRDDERNKIMEYYSKLNMEVEKSKIHTEWKMKRLQLDQSRMQLLSTEERNLKREKLELEHQRNEVMAMSTQSDCFRDESDPKDDEIVAAIDPKMTKSDSLVIGESSSPNDNAKSTSDMFSVLCNAAKSIFGVSKTPDDNNVLKLDAQGNILPDTTTSSEVIGNKLDWAHDNEQFLKMRQEAYLNKQKVMAHEFGQLDKENNPMKDPPLIPSIDEENNFEDIWSPFAEAKRNKLKVLGAEFGMAKPEGAPIVTEPRTDAHKEALVNRQKVLGVEYNLPKDVTKREPATEAQEEALVNKQKIMGVEYNLPAEETVQREPANEAQEEALVNRNKIMGVEYNLPAEETIRKEPANIAQEEALINRNKIMGVEYNLPAEETAQKEPATEAQEKALVNRNKIMGVEYNLPAIEIAQREPANAAQEEALVNRNKIMGVEYNLPIEIAQREPATKAQHEALANRHKVMGVEYNLPLDATRREPATEAQEQALKNRKKVMNSDFEGIEPSRKPQRSGLTLNLKPFGETSSQLLGVTPNTGAVTPGEFYSRLDLETPTTADVPLESAVTSDFFTPRSEGSKDLDSGKKTDKDLITSEGFTFPVIDDDTIDSEIISDVQTGESPEVSPSKIGLESKNFKRNISFFNILDGSYNLDEFDPFGVKDLKSYSKDHFHSKMDLEMASSCYTHPAIIMEEVKKRPYSNIFASHFEEEKDEKITNDNIATLTACLQRSVMLPLTYQLEIVNNSILTYFLVNLDMYEHLRSLKDYFFLMDGEFSRSICHNLFSKLTKTLNPQELLNFATLHNILDKALGSSISHVHKFSENLSFTITESPLSFQHSSPDVLQCLSLTYAVCWPLNIILSQEALLRYAKVFQFLLKMRRIFWVLGEDFESLKLSVKLSKQNSRKLLKSPHYTSIQIYRHIMASMIRALDNYIVTTCILSSWTEFENDLTKARTLDDLYECHVVYIKKVLFRCLLNNRSTPVMKLLNDIFTVILKFSRVLKAGEWQQQEPNGHFTHTNFTQLEELFHLFEKLAKYLHKVVTKLMECGYQRHLVELLTMVNLNGYYDPERTKEDHNVSAMSTGF